MTNQVYCFGEVLYDLLPDGAQAGGAPMNVAIHLSNFGIKTAMISRVGDDDLGKNIVAFMNEREVDTSFVGTDKNYKTGTVPVTFSEKNEPQYTIAHPAAWDFISVTPAALSALEKSDVLVYGSLACRDKPNFDTLQGVLTEVQMKKSLQHGYVLCVFDVNIRAPFYDKEKIFALMRLSDVVKMNEDEFEILGNWMDIKTSDTAKGEIILKSFNLKLLVVTQGARGAVAFQDNKTYTASTPRIEKVADTIGCGDSFLAAFIKKYVFDKLSITEALSFACATGALVATYKGGTPCITEEDVHKLM